MVVLTAISASLYAAILIPFKVMPIIPGVTEFRPANAVPVVCSFLFGPAAAWGAAIGNVIGDFFGGIGPGDLFGFVGNFLYGYVPYKLWAAFTDADPLPRSPLRLAGLLAVVALACAACALTIGWGLDLMGFVPFQVLANIILLNNFVVAAVLGPLLLVAIYPRVKRARLRYSDILPPAPPRARALRWLGVALIVIATAGGFVCGNLLAGGWLVVPGLPPAGVAGQSPVRLGLLPFVLLLFAGAALL
jgi:energy-coupling factor transport system substrate-specific component